VENNLPNKIVFRGNRIKIDRHSRLINTSKVKIEYISYYSQFIFQSKFFKNGIIDLILAELNYEKNNIIKKILYFIKSFKSGIFLGCSTGLFTTLYALERFPDHNVYLYGISLEGGRQFYNKNKSANKAFNRYNVDQFLFKKLKTSFADRIFFC